ncbi:MAG TPA: hypothetical protein VM843_08215 [Flavisolibacter sp.]|nr:hypothetical protein [Flavisolibacter sp.]
MKQVLFSCPYLSVSIKQCRRSFILSSSFLFLVLLAGFNGNAQVKIGSNPNTINANSLLELESSNKGFLPPRVAINDLNAVAPLTGTVPAGMLVYSFQGTVPDGYYFWSGSNWSAIGQSNMVAKNASTTLQKTETFVLASNDIMLTLPTVAAAHNGLAITIKNVGTPTNLVVVKGSTATIDGVDSANLTRWQSKTFVAYNGNWLTKEKESGTYNILEVSPTGSWTTIEEAVEFLGVHMTGPSILRLSGDDVSIAATILLDLDFALTIQGASFGKTTIAPASGLVGPLFKARSECYFKMLAFDAGNTYSNITGNDAIQFDGAGEYYEVKDCNFNGFNKTLAAKKNVELWVFETDINNAKDAGIDIGAGAADTVTLKVSEVDFIACAKGINLGTSKGALVSILNSTFYNATGGIGINYNPTTFVTFSSMFITNNAWNNTGSFFNGFDFSRPDGRDARAFIQNNAGDPNRNPSCHLSVLNSTTATTLQIANTWYKAAWDYAVTTVNTTKWTVANAAGTGNVNRITYQTTNKRSGYFIISGNLLLNTATETISIAVYRNGITSVRFGEITVRTGNANTPTVFSTIVYLPQISIGDYFEIGLSSTSGSITATLQDVQWLAETK